MGIHAPTNHASQIKSGQIAFLRVGIVARVSFFVVGKLHANLFQKSEIGKDIELGAVDVGEVGTIAVGDTALMASSVVDGPAGAAASAGLDVAASEGADALRDKIKNS